jgi:hypothetical protein
MNPNQKTSYEFFKALKVKDIAERCDIIPPETPAHEVYEELIFTPYETILLVQNEEKTFGYLAIDDPDDLTPESQGTAGDIAVPIPSRMLIPNDVGIIELLKRFEDRPFYFVESGNKITHCVSRDTLESYSIRATLFSLSLEFEDRIVTILQRYGDEKLAEAFRKLTSVRLDKINQLYCTVQNYKFKQKTNNQSFFQFTQGNYEQISCPKYSELVRYTNFYDKKRLVRSFPGLVASLPFDSLQEYNRFFDWLLDLRNIIAHGDLLYSLLTSAEDSRKNIMDLIVCIEITREIIKEYEEM